MMDFDLTVGFLRRRAADLFSARPVVSYAPDGSVRRTSYGEVMCRAHSVACQLVSDGVKPGDRVATLMWNHDAHLEVYFGVPLAGATLHTVNHRLSADDIVHVINHAQDKVVIVDDILLDLYEGIRERLASVESVVVFSYGGGGRSRWLDYDEWVGRPLGKVDLPEINENDSASLCYTGGSTGRPKGVIYSHRALVLHAFAQAMVDGYGIGRTSSVLAAVPMFHGNGWGLPFSAVMTGAKLVLPGRHVDAESILRIFEREEITLSAGVPTVWIDVAGALETRPAEWRLPRNGVIITGGAPPPRSLFGRLSRYGLSLFQGWGMTETASIVTMARPAPEHTPPDVSTDDQLIERQGVPMPIAEVRVVREGHPVPPDGKAMGDIEVRGATVAAEYDRQPGMEDRWTADGWLRTGDLGTIDMHGSIQVVDRKEDLIKSGGEWIAPLDLESTILEHPEVMDCAVIAVPDDKWGERPLAMLVLNESARMDSEVLRKHLLNRFAKWQLPDAFIVVPRLPRTSVGKVSRRSLRSDFSCWKSGMVDGGNRNWHFLD